METKKQIRREVLAVRDALNKEVHKTWSQTICDKVRTMSEYKNAGCILFFVPYGSEVDVKPLIEEALQQGRQVFCPFVTGDQMMFYRIDNFSQLKEGYKGILEPIPEDERSYVPNTADFMIVPGTVFDREGNRIGYGKGFYDRFLTETYVGSLAAVAFSHQIVENGRIHAESTDRKIKLIVTEQGIIRTEKGE